MLADRDFFCCPEQEARLGNGIITLTIVIARWHLVAICTGMKEKEAVSARTGLSDFNVCHGFRGS